MPAAKTRKLRVCTSSKEIIHKERVKHIGGQAVRYWEPIGVAGARASAKKPSAKKPTRKK